MATKSNGKSNRGGARPGAGRKPKAVKALAAALISQSEDAATYAMRLLDEFQRDKEKDPRLRFDCAKLILDRCLGKPRQSVEHTGADGRVLFPPERQQKLLGDPIALQAALTIDVRLAQPESDHPGGIRPPGEPGEVDLPAAPGPAEPEAG